MALKPSVSTIQHMPVFGSPDCFELLDAFQRSVVRGQEQLWPVPSVLDLPQLCSRQGQGSTHLGLSDKIQDTQ